MDSNSCFENSISYQQIENVRRRPQMYFGSVDSCGLQNATMDLINYCIEEKRNNLEIVVNGSDISVRHDGKALPNCLDIEVVKAACDSFQYKNNQYQLRFGKELFTTTELNIDALFDRLRELAFLNKALSIRFNERLFHYENGLVDFYEYLRTKRGWYLQQRHTPLSFFAKEGNIELDVLFASVDSFDPCMFSFVNNRRTEDHGAHVNGFKAGIREALRKHKQGCADGKTNIKYYDLALIIHARVQNPEYYGSTRREVKNPEVYRFVKKATKQYLDEVFGRQLGFGYDLHQVVSRHRNR